MRAQKKMADGQMEELSQ
ncbi:hypothetical protein A2U01_0044610, partial [Trifolium medium]|nr:hypothetical protein [Trifolium medium]